MAKWNMDIPEDTPFKNKNLEKACTIAQKVINIIIDDLGIDYDGMFSNNNVVVAGGFLRDVWLNKPVSDIDVFVEKYYVRGARKKMASIGYESIGLELDAAKYSHDYISDIFTYNHPDIPHPINLIVKAAGVFDKAVINLFDFGICKIAFAEGMLSVSPMFLKDINCKTLTLYRSDWGQEGVQAHYNKLKQKYPDFKFVNEGNLEIIE